MAEAKFYVQEGNQMWGPWDEQAPAADFRQELSEKRILWIIWDAVEGSQCGHVIDEVPREPG